MTEPVTAEEVLVSALRGAWRRDGGPTRLAEACVAALREACGGGDIVIRTDGTLWRNAMPVDLDTDPVHHLCIVPAGER